MIYMETGMIQEQILQSTPVGANVALCITKITLLKGKVLDLFVCKAIHRKCVTLEK